MSNKTKNFKKSRKHNKTRKNKDYLSEELSNAMPFIVASSGGGDIAVYRLKKNKE